MKRFSRSKVKVKVICVQVCKCYNGYNTHFDGVESRLTCFVMYKTAHVRQLAQYGDYSFESSHRFRANTASGPEDKCNFQPSTVSVSYEIHLLPSRFQNLSVLLT